MFCPVENVNVTFLLSNERRAVAFRYDFYVFLFTLRFVFFETLSQVSAGTNPDASFGRRKYRLSLPKVATNRAVFREWFPFVSC